MRRSNRALRGHEEECFGGLRGAAAVAAAAVTVGEEHHTPLGRIAGERAKIVYRQSRGVEGLSSHIVGSSKEPLTQWGDRQAFDEIPRPSEVEVLGEDGHADPVCQKVTAT